MTEDTVLYVDVDWGGHENWTITCFVCCTPDPSRFPVEFPQLTGRPDQLIDYLLLQISRYEPRLVVLNAPITFETMVKYYRPNFSKSVKLYGLRTL